MEQTITFSLNGGLYLALIVCWVISVSKFVQLCNVFDYWMLGNHNWACLCHGLWCKEFLLFISENVGRFQG